MVEPPFPGVNGGKIGHKRYGVPLRAVVSGEDGSLSVNHQTGRLLRLLIRSHANNSIRAGSLL